MVGTNWALVSAGATCVFAPSGSGGVSTTLPIDGNDATGATLNTNATWNVLVTLPASKTIDAFRVLLDKEQRYIVQQVQDPGNDTTWITIASGRGAESGIIGLAQPTLARQFNLRVFVDSQPVSARTFELWEGAIPAPATPGDVNNDLAAWLSTTDGTHSDSAPLQDHTTLATVASVVGSTAGQLDATKTAVDNQQAQQNDWAFGLGAAAHGYFGDVKTLITNIKSITDTLPTPISQLTSIVLDHYTADIDLILANIDTVLSNLGAQSTDLSGTAGSAVGALSGRSGFPAGGWAMSAETDFNDNIAFVEPADAYVLSIISYQPTQPATSTAAGLWLPRLGWWCVLNGSLASQRSFVDFEQMLLTDQGRRMPGCAIELKPGTLAHVQAWLLA